MSESVDAVCGVPHPGLLKPSPQHTAVLAITIIFPFVLLSMVLVFWYYQNESIYLRKRKISIILISCAVSSTIWGSTAIYDFVGSQVYPCWLLFLLAYMTVPLFNVPGTYVVLRYAQEVAALRMKQSQAAGDGQLENPRISSAGEKQVFVYKPEATCETFTAFIRVVFFKNKDRRMRLLASKFGQTWYSLLFWSLVGIFPFPIAFIIRFSMNPQWATCSGCDIQPVDAIILMICNLIGFSFAFSGNSKKVKQRDALRVVREWLYVWSWCSLLFCTAFALFLADPGGLYAQGIFNWRLLLLATPLTAVYIQTIHQIIVARQLKRKMLLLPAINFNERFDDVMRDRVLFGRLRTFLDAELSNEILQFLEAVKEFKQNYGKEGSQRRARIILDKFVQRGSKSEINIASDLRFRLTCALTVGNVPVEVFDEAYDAIKNALLVDGFARFLQKISQEEALRRPSKTWTLSRGGSKRFASEDSEERGASGGGGGLHSSIVSPHPTSEQ